MNIAYFLLPKSQTAWLYDDCTFRQGLERMRRHGYTAIPVIRRDGQYAGTVSEGDFLWHLIPELGDQMKTIPLKTLENIPISRILNPEAYPAVHITVSMEEMLQRAMQQNFIPVVDDTGIFIGIVTRNAIIKYYAGSQKAAAVSAALLG